MIYTMVERKEKGIDLYQMVREWIFRTYGLTGIVGSTSDSDYYFTMSYRYQDRVIQAMLQDVFKRKEAPDVIWEREYNDMNRMEAFESGVHEVLTNVLREMK